jgi:hypothetical protein
LSHRRKKEQHKYYKNHMETQTHKQLNKTKTKSRIYNKVNSSSSSSSSGSSSSRVKVKQSHYRPVSRRMRFPDFKTIGT